MYRFKNAFKKSTALLVVAVLVLSLFSANFSIFAADLTDSLTYSFENPGVVTDCDLMNDLSDLELPAEIIGEPNVAINNGTTVTSTGFNPNAALTDYTIAAGADSTGKHFYTIKDGATYDDKSLDSIKEWNDGAYTQLIIPFNTPIKLKHIVVAGMHRNANWRIGEYEIYASSARGELFLSENMVYQRDNTSDKNQIELYSFKDGKELRYISYIAIRIYKPHASVDLAGNTLETAIRPRLFEFNAYGTPEDADYSLTQDFTVKDNTDSINLSNTVKSAATSFSYTIDGVTTSTSATNGGQINDYDLTKGGWLSGVYPVFFDPAEGKDYTATTVDAIGTRHINGLNKNTGNDQYVTIETELLSEVDIEDILVVNHPTNYLKTGVYEIFAAATKADLYKNSVIRFDNTSVKKQIQDFHFDTDKELKGIKYVAMRIYNPMTDWYGSEAQNLYSSPDQRVKAIYPRLMEFNVYGTWSDPDFDPDSYTIKLNADGIDTTKTVNWKSAKFEFTDESGTTTVGMAEGGAKTYDYKYDTGDYLASNKAFYDLKDGFTSASTDINGIAKKYTDGSRYFTMTLEADTEMNLSDIVLVNHPTNQAIRTKSYEIFASDKLSTLFDAASSVAKYDNAAGDHIQNVHFADGKPLENVKYLALRIYDPINSWESQGIKSLIASQGIKAIYPRIMEFNAYGVYSDPNYTPADYTLNLDADDVDTTKTIGWNSSKFEFTDENGTTSITMAEGGSKIYDYKYDTGDYAATNKSFIDIKDGYEVTSTDVNAIEKIYTDGTRYFTMTLEAETEMNLSDIVLVNHPNKILRTGSYEIFASDKLSTLFDAENSVVKYDNSSGDQIQNIHYEEGKELENIKYIALRIYSPINSWEGASFNNFVQGYGLHQLYPRIMEFNAYGVYSDPNYQPPAFKVYGTMDNIDTEKTFQKTLTAEFTKNGNTEKVSWTGQDKINDSLANTGSEFHYSSGTKFWELKEGYSLSDTDPNGVGEIYTDGSRYLDLTYKMPTETKISDILVAQHHNGQLMLGKYEIYASADRETLYTEDNLIGKYDSSEGASQIQDFHWAEGNELTGIKYVGMRITDPFANWEKSKELVKRADLGLKTLYPRVMEFNIYGEYEDPNFVPEKYTDTAGYDLSALSGYGVNLVSGVLPTFFGEGKRAAVRPATATAVRNKVSEIPSNDTVHYDISDPALLNKEYFDIQWKLQDAYKLELYRVKGFAFQGMWRDMPDYYASHYQVYVAYDAEDLYKPENMVFEYKADEMGVMKGIVYEFPESKAPVGGYIALRIIEPANGASANANPRLSVFYVWGEDPQIIPEPTNLAENMPIDAYFVANEMEKVSESNLTAKEVMNMTDADDDTFAKIDTKADNRKTTEIIYNLCGDMVVDNISINTLINSDTGFETMKVYASDTLAGVNQESALIWTQKAGSKKGEVEFSKTIASNDAMRYVRFVFEGCKDYLQISTINIEGLDNQKNKTRELTSTLNVSTHVNIQDINLETGKESTLAFNDAAKSAIFDSVAETYPVVAHEGVVGKNEFDMIIQMDDLRTINQMKLSFMYGFDEYYADTINVYIAEVMDEIVGDTKRTEPDYVINKDDVENQTIEFAMRPRLVRYIKLEFRGFEKIEGMQYDDSNEYQLTSIIPDMSFKGTKVKGMQTSEESETLISFTDEATGIKADILRLDTNDIFTDAAGIKVTPENATNWQMLSLKNNPFLKVVDKQNYKVEFVDLYGNVINDLKGRNVDITFTVPDGANADEFMVGEATVRTKMMALETYPVNNTVTASALWAQGQDNKFALLQMVNEDDPYWDTIGELEDFSEGSEEDLKGDNEPEEDTEEKSEEWYKTIRTEDGRFEVKGVDADLAAGIQFTAKDVSAEVSDDLYLLLGQIIGDKKVAAIYDFSFTLDNEPYIHTGVVDVKLALPDFIKNNYTDLQVIHLLDETTATMPWCETIDDDFYFQTDSFSNFVIIGTALNPSSPSDDSNNGTADGNDGITDGESIPQDGTTDNIPQDGITDNVQPDAPIVDDGIVDDGFGVGDDTIVQDGLQEGTLDGTASPETGEDGITVPVLLTIVAAAFVIMRTSRKKVR